LRRAFYLSIPSSESGNNFVKYLQRIRLEGELRRVFVEKSSTAKILFRGIRIISSYLPSINTLEPVKQIDKLDFIEGSFRQLR